MTRAPLRIAAAVAAAGLALPGTVAAQDTRGVIDAAAWAQVASPDQTPSPDQTGSPDQTPPPDQAPSPEAAAPQAPPEPAHTGVSAFVRTLGSDFVAFPRRESTWVILGIGGALALAALPIDKEFNARLAGSSAAARFFAPGKVIGSTWVQGGVSVGLYVFGRYVLPAIDEDTPKTNRVSHLGYDLLRAQVVTQVLVQSVKVAVRRDRPTGECCSFPSGHAASAFAMASVLERHLGYRAAVPTMVVAAYVAASRLHDNRHYLSDVAFGSALGMATGWTVVGRHGRSSYAVVPLPVDGGVEVALIRVNRFGG